MSRKAPRQHNSPFTDTLPEVIYFRSADMPADSQYPVHAHAWGEFVYSYRGVMEVRMGDRHYLAPSQYGLWLPPQVEHQGLNRLAASHCSIYVSPGFCTALPQTTCALEVSALTRSLLEHLRTRAFASPYSAADARLLHVVLDQLHTAPCAGSYLPGTTDALLQPVLDYLTAHPGDNQPIADLARRFHTTERTLARRANMLLGMSLAQWRQRLRAVQAMQRLESGDKVESIALDLGYASASAFIAMFRKLMGMTPDEYRRSR